MKNKLINQHRERCLLEVGILPMGSMVWHHPHCALATSKQKMSPSYTFLEDELGSLLEVPVLCWGTASSYGHHVDSQGKKPSHCLMALHPVTLGLLPSSACGEEVAHAAGRWAGPSSIRHHQLLTRVYLIRHSGEYRAGQPLWWELAGSCRARAHCLTTRQPSSLQKVPRKSPAVTVCRGTMRHPKGESPTCQEVFGGKFCSLQKVGEGFGVDCPGS